jgi:hypothetical protein
VNEETIWNTVDEHPVQHGTALGPRLVGLALICVALFALATIAGLIANAAA